MSKNLKPLAIVRPRDQLYEVFARRNSEEALTHVGSVRAPNEELAEVQAWYVCDQHEWKEICLAPTNAFIAITERNRAIKVKEF
jgi:1,2-phenylacetyl-CoA epoxidase PaaB subunit